MKRPALVVLFFLSFFSVHGELVFGGLDLNSDNQLLFSAEVDVPGKESYSVLFSHNLDLGQTIQQTWYPESLQILDQGRILQVRNRFGVVRYQTAARKLTLMEGFKDFTKGATITSGALPPFSTSPDGEWIVYWSGKTFTTGDLILSDVKTGDFYTVAEDVERYTGNTPVLWASDSSAFIYENNGRLFFSRPGFYNSTTTVVEENFRYIGEGTLSNVSWYSPNRFVYINGDSVFNVYVSELFTRSLYSDLLGIGNLCGKLPFDFESSYDKFQVSPSGDQIMVSVKNRLVFYISLNGDDYSYPAGGIVRPSLFLPGNCADVGFFWTATGDPVVVSYSVESGKLKTHLFRARQENQNLTAFESLPVPENAKDFSLSTDARKMAVLTDEGVIVYDFETWNQTGSLLTEEVVSADWGDSITLYVGGVETVRSWNTLTGKTSILFFSSVNSYGWEEGSNSIVVDSQGKRYVQNSRGIWDEKPDALTTKVSNQNSQWRVYLDTSKSPLFLNSIYLRQNTGLSRTVPLFNDPVCMYDNLENYREEADNKDGVFFHGSRTKKREIALTFDALDNSEGIPSILFILNKYGIKATFFLNGEFMRRNPSAVKEITLAGHEIGSMFFTTSDLNSSKYKIDKNFISRGLARNEDDYYGITGKELSLLWHPAYYTLSDIIVSAGKEAGYTYVGYDVDSLDWVCLEDSGTLTGLYMNSSKLVERILAEKKPGSVIPIRVGSPAGTRTDYLYDKLELLINGLLESGYDIVPVSSLIKDSF